MTVRTLPQFQGKVSVLTYCPVGYPVQSSHLEKEKAGSS
jgi:hypothetical protein